MNNMMIFDVPFSTALLFLRNGIEIYLLPYSVIAVLVIIVLSVTRIFGFLNPGNLPVYGVKKQSRNEKSPLKGKNFIFLGSSITKGFAAYGTSFVDNIAYRNDCICVKEAVSGTTLIDNSPKSYVNRLKGIDVGIKCDVFVCQLSTNDAARNSPMGIMSEKKDMDSFNTKTVYGAVEYIISYAKSIWDCPVVFYTSPQYASPKYQEIVFALEKVAAKWEIQIIDLWSSKELNEKRSISFRMNDQIHPTKKGYMAWTPVFESALADVLAGREIQIVKGLVPALEQTRKRQIKKRILNYAKLAGIIIFTTVVVLGMCVFAVV